MFTIVGGCYGSNMFLGGEYSFIIGALLLLRPALTKIRTYVLEKYKIGRIFLKIFCFK